MAEQPSEKPLYQDDEITIEYHPSSVEDHVLHVTYDGTDRLSYLLQRGILHDLATTQRGGIESKISNFNPELLFHLKEKNIGIDGLHVAICQAYAEEEARVSYNRLEP
jgi:hypothetical protein